MYYAYMYYMYGVRSASGRSPHPDTHRMLMWSKRCCCEVREVRYSLWENLAVLEPADQ